MHEHVDMVAGNPEGVGDVIARAFFEKTQCDDRPLHATETRDAGAKSDRVFGAE